jgi:hypothetical protein
MKPGADKLWVNCRQRVYRVHWVQTVSPRLFVLLAAEVARVEVRGELLRRVAFESKFAFESKV